MNYYEHHIGDYIKATAHLSMLEDAAYRRLIDAYYTKEAPLPADRKACHRLARATSKPERDAVDTVLDEFFVLADDGWHQSRCDEELARYINKRPAAEEKRENDKERQRRARERRKQLFEELSNHGINMPWNTTTEMLQTELSRVTSSGSSQPVTEPVTRDNTATQTPDTRHQTPEVNPLSLAHASTTSTGGTPAGAASARMRQAGLQDANPQHPKLIALLDAGITADELASAAAEAVAKGKGFAYALAMAEGRRRDAAAAGSLPAARASPADGRGESRAAASRQLTGRGEDHGRNERDITGEATRLA